MTTNNNRHHIHHHEHLDEAEIYKRKNLSAAQRRKKLAKILFRVLCVIAVAITWAHPINPGDNSLVL